jgi:hypothetical protein
MHGLQDCRDFIDDEGFLVLPGSANPKPFCLFADVRVELIEIKARRPFRPFELKVKTGYVTSVIAEERLVVMEVRVCIVEPGDWHYETEIDGLIGFRFID